MNEFDRIDGPEGEEDDDLPPNPLEYDDMSITKGILIAILVIGLMAGLLGIIFGGHR